MMIKKRFVVATLAAMMICGTASARKPGILEPVHQDYFQSVRYLATEDGFLSAAIWLTPPTAKPAVVGYRPMMPGAERAKYISSFTMLPPTILTENYLGAGSTLSIKTEGFTESLQAILNKNTLATVTYLNFNVKTSGPGLLMNEPFKGMAASIRRKANLPFMKAGAEYEYMAIDNSLDTVHYGAVTTTDRIGDNLSVTVGAGFVDSSSGVRDTGVIGGARYGITPTISLYANYNGADPMKHIYNNHLLAIADRTAGTVDCSNCAAESFNAGALVRFGSNMALNVYGFDLTDLSSSAASLMYIVKE